ncbi:invasion associated locus B family protein [Nitrobacter hamburgensis]|nr:invasion associated locus B family protein [Nitrobacter hamburgensis]
MTAVLSGGLACAQTSRSPHPPSLAANSPQASTSTSTFEDWIVRCEVKPPGSKVCEAVQTIAARNQQQQQNVIAEVVFGRLAKTEPFKLIIQLPPGVYLPSGARLVLDDKTPPLAATFTRCLQTCMAEAELKPETVQILKARPKPNRDVWNSKMARITS